MTITDTCAHCGYRIPATASLCSGCGRRHEIVAPRLEDRPLPRSPLLREARWARRFVAVGGWLGLALLLVAAARGVASIDSIRDDLDADALLRLDHAGRLVALSALLSLGATTAVSFVWIRRTRRNAELLGLPTGLTSTWSLPGWLVPGTAARRAKAQVDQEWRDQSPLLGALPGRGSSRRLVSRVVLRWWALWLWLPATVVLVALVAHADEGALHEGRGLAAITAGALLVATARSYFDVIGIITVAHAHRTDHVVHDAWAAPWDTDGEVDEATEVVEPPAPEPQPDEGLASIGGWFIHSDR
jgi:hypothetical protein